MKQPGWSVSIVTPVYNNRRTLESVIASIDSLVRLSTQSYELLLIDDGSTDGSYQLVETLQKKYKHIRLLSHNKNLGIAKTYRHLYAEACYSHIVLFSLDGEWNPHDVIRLLQEAQKTNADMVIGQRTKKAYSIGRLLVSQVYNRVTQWFFGVVTYDAGSIKYVRKELVSRVPIRSKGVFDEAERIIRAKRMGYSIHSVPVSHYASKKTEAFGVKWSLLIEAVQDLLFVWWDILVASRTKQHKVQ